MDNRFWGYLIAILLTIALFSPYIDFKRVGRSALVWGLNFASVLISPKMLLTFGIAWMITNGWSYLFVAFGIAFDIKWMLGIGTAYQTFLWFPFTPEKIVTVAIAIWLSKKLFPKDIKLQEQIRALNPKNLVK